MFLRHLLVFILKRGIFSEFLYFSLLFFCLWRETSILGGESSVSVSGQFLDRVGRVRLNAVREVYRDPTLVNFGEIIDIYEFWRDQDEYIVLGIIDLEPFKPTRWLALKCAKRGNDKYVWKVSKKLSSLKDLKNVKVKFVTFTCDPKDYSGIREAWEDMGRRQNRVNCWLRRHFGKNFLGFLRVWEGYKSGLPHAHMICFFKKAVWLDKKQLEKTSNSFVRIKDVRSLREVSRYVTKYLVKCFNSETYKDRLTNALMWLFRKQGYGLSRGLITTKRNSNGIMVQTTLDGGYYWVEFEFMGVYPAFLIGVKGSDWVVSLDRPPPKLEGNREVWVKEMMEDMN